MTAHRLLALWFLTSLKASRRTRQPPLGLMLEVLDLGEAVRGR